MKLTLYDVAEWVAIALLVVCYIYMLKVIVSGGVLAILEKLSDVFTGSALVAETMRRVKKLKRYIYMALMSGCVKVIEI